MDYTSVSLRLHAPCRDCDMMNCILWLYSRSFFFLFSSNLNAFFPFYDVTWSECGIVFLPLNYLTNSSSATFPSGDISCVSHSWVVDCENMYMYRFSCFANDISDLFWLVCMDKTLGHFAFQNLNLKGPQKMTHMNTYAFYGFPLYLCIL